MKKHKNMVTPLTLTPKGKGATLTLAWGDRSFSTVIAPGK